MARTIQFRCPECLKLLFKYEIGSERLMNKAEGLIFLSKTGHNAQDPVCPKCNTRSEITPRGLRKIDLIMVKRDTLAQARPAQHIAAPA